MWRRSLCCRSSLRSRRRRRRRRQLQQPPGRAQSRRRRSAANKRTWAHRLPHMHLRSVSCAKSYLPIEMPFPTTSKSRAHSRDPSQRHSSSLPLRLAASIQASHAPLSIDRPLRTFPGGPHKATLGLSRPLRPVVSLGRGRCQLRRQSLSPRHARAGHRDDV